MAIFRRGPANRGAECRWGRQKSRFSTNICLYCVLSKRLDGQVLYIQLRYTVASWWHSSLVSGIVCCSRKTTTWCLWQEASTLREDNRTERHLIERSGKSEAEVTNNKRLRSRYCTVEANYTERHEASRGLSATAELLVAATAELLVVFYYLLARCISTFSVNFFPVR